MRYWRRPSGRDWWFYRKAMRDYKKALKRWRTRHNNWRRWNLLYRRWRAAWLAQGETSTDPDDFDDTD